MLKAAPHPRVRVQAWCTSNKLHELPLTICQINRKVVQSNAAVHILLFLLPLTICFYVFGFSSPAELNGLCIGKKGHVFFYIACNLESCASHGKQAFGNSDGYIMKPSHEEDFAKVSFLSN